jgi:hypothetical protein
MKNHSEMIKNPFESIFKNFNFKSVLVLLIILFNCVIFFIFYQILNCSSIYIIIIIKLSWKTKIPLNVIFKFLASSDILNILSCN